MIAMLLWGASLTGCVGSEEATPAPAPAPVQAPAPDATPGDGSRGGKGKKGKGKRPAGGGEAEQADPQPKIPAQGVPDPLAGLTDKDLCTSDSLLMLKYSFAELQGGKCAEVCCAVDQDHWCCGLDWPSSDVMTCSQYGYMRNAIFARYGYPFTEEKWKKEFGDKPYYTRREDFDAKWLTKVAADNVATLKTREEKREACMDAP